MNDSKKKLKTSGPPLADFETTTVTFNSLPALLCHSPKECILVLKVNNNLHHSLNGHPIIGEIRARRQTLLDALQKAHCSSITLYTIWLAIWTIKCSQPFEWLLLKQVKKQPTIHFKPILGPCRVETLHEIVLTFRSDERPLGQTKG
jgi:hypothetical protein